MHPPLERRISQSNIDACPIGGDNGRPCQVEPEGLVSNLVRSSTALKRDAKGNTPALVTGGIHYLLLRAVRAGRVPPSAAGPVRLE